MTQIYVYGMHVISGLVLPGRSSLRGEVSAAGGGGGEGSEGGGGGRVGGSGGKRGRLCLWRCSPAWLSRHG